MTPTVSSQTGTIARSAGTVGVAVFSSRILGLIREQVFAGMFGAGYAIDAFVVAFRIPNLLRDLFAEGALSSAFVTVFTDYDQRQGAARTWRLANNVMTTIGLLVVVISILGIINSLSLVRLLAPDFGKVPGKLGLTALMTQIMFPFLPLISLAAVVMGILNSKGRFFIPALASSFFNLGSILFGVTLTFVAPRFGYPAIVGMAVGTLIGGLLQLVGQIPVLFRVGYRPQLCFDLRDKGLHRILRLMAPAVIGLSATQFNIFINTFFASSCAQGSVSWLNYAFRLMQFPIGIFGVALAIATLPVVSRYASKGDLEGLKAALVSSLSMAMIITVPASAGLAALAQPVIALIFEHGRFSVFDTQQTAAALALYALGLFAYAGVKIVVPVFYALDDTRFPVIGSFITVAANLFFITLTLEAFQHRAIALSTSLSVIINFVFLSAILYRKLKGYSVGYLGWCLGKVTVASLIMGLLVIPLHTYMTTLLGTGLVGQIANLLVTILIGAGIYGLLVYVFRVPEFTELIRQVATRRGKPTG
ncbi:MAG: murein biosynthesis integral membrane protein MurJ [Deltaproteobacteria bacterium]|nr:murein biosynthesis integral membrane protein MurJ [Deltaproteobacteria bacterium]